MNKTIKVISIIMLIVMMAFTSTTVYATTNNTGELKPNGITATYGDDDGGLSNTAGKIMGMIRNISVVAAVILIMVLGVKFMLGSVEEKAEYKKSFMPLIIGILCVVAATSIASFIFNMTS